MAVVFASIGDKIGVNFVRYKCYRSVVMEDVDVGGMAMITVARWC